MKGINELALTFLFNAAWQVTAVAAVTALCARLLVRAPAARRHALWVVALVLGVALPLWSVVGAWHSPPPAAAESRGSAMPVSTGASVPTAFTPTVAATTVAVPVASGRGVGQPGGVLVREGGRYFLSVPPAAVALTLLYALFLVYRLGKLLLAWRRTCRIRSSAQRREVSGLTARVAARCRDEFKVGSVALLASPRAKAPAAAGLFRPVILLPPALFEETSEETLASVIGHEMAHVARRDFALNLLCELLYLPLAFHPLAAYVRRQIGRTRELACDEMVAGRILAPRDYARSLVRVAGSLAAPARQSYTLGVFDADVLEERVERLLSVGPGTGRRARRLLTLSAMSLLASACVAASAFSLSLRPAAAADGARLAAVTGPLADAAAWWETDARPDAPRQLDALSSPEADTRAAAACALGRARAVEAVPALVRLLGDEAAIKPVRCWSGGPWTPALATFRRPSPGEEAAIALAAMGTASVGPLTAALADGDPAVRRNAAWALGEVRGGRLQDRTAAVGPLMLALSDADEWVRAAAARALGEIQDARSVESLVAALSDASAGVRERSAWALGEMKAERAHGPLASLASGDAERRVRVVAAWALAEIRGDSADPQPAQAPGESDLGSREPAHIAPDGGVTVAAPDQSQSGGGRAFAREETRTLGRGFRRLK